MLRNDLLIYICGSPSQPVALSLAQWMTETPRFAVFVETYRDKIRKKLHNARDAESQSDVLCELATAQRVLRDRRFSLEYEKYGVGTRRGPDFTASFRVNTPVNIEVTRLRLAATDPQTISRRVVTTLWAKLGQMPPQVINVLVMAADAADFGAADVAETLKNLHVRADRKDEAYFTQAGFADAAHFLKQMTQLSGIIFDGAWQSDTPARFLWPNPRARQRIPDDIRSALVAQLFQTP